MLVVATLACPSRRWIMLTGIVSAECAPRVCLSQCVEAFAIFLASS